ncbi:MAG TPA: mechanosensitive ion channel domain-containing protein [Gammaproteobacteria bacterium]|nr:mechanosensitive ion channel domain-containing protein [Gammaproteobacteria bacterium]
MEDLLSVDRLLAVWNGVYLWLSTNVFAVDVAVQAGIIGLTLLIAVLLAKRLRAWLARYRDYRNVGRGVLIAEPLAFPVIWFALLWLATAVVGFGEQPNGLLSTAATLLAAWIAIHLASQFVRHRTWAKLISWAAWSIAALSILNLLEPTIAVLDALAVPIGRETTISVWDVLRSTIALAVLLSVALYLASLLEARIRTSQTLSPTVQVLFTKSLKTVLVSLAVVFAIDAVGIDLRGLAVLGGLAVVALGFGLQKIVSNLISGVVLLLDKSIKPGDIISVTGTYGWVTALGGRYVSVVTRDGVEHLIPNETLISQPVENWTHTQRRTRLKVDISAHHESDLRQVIALCEEAARAVERVLPEPEPKCLFIEWGESALKLQLRFWIGDAQNGVQNVKSEVLLQIWDRFKQHGVRVPYPQRDLHIRSDAERAPLQALA